MYYLLVILSVFVASFAQMLLKKGATLPHNSAIGEYLNPWVLGGYVLLGISLVVNIYAMSKGVLVKDVGIIESLSYLFVPVLAMLCFREKISFRKIISIVLILVGILIFFHE